MSGNQEMDSLTKGVNSILQSKAEKKAKKSIKTEIVEEDAISKGKYSIKPLSDFNIKEGRLFTKIVEISDFHESKEVLIRARLASVRAFGKNCFIILRQPFATLQCVLSQSSTVSKKMIKFVAGIARESIVDITGSIVRATQPVQSCTIHDFELSVSEVHVISQAIPMLPLQVEDAARPETSEISYVNQDTRLNNRVLDLRTNSNHAIFQLQAAICQLFREFLNSNNFVELHFPKIIGTASEGGANVFKVDYFNRPAYLAQSPQLYKQMAITADFERVYTIGPVFRAEDSNTHRHLTEFVGLDVEMVIYEHYHEALNMIKNLFVYIFKNIEERYASLVETIRQQFPSEPFRFCSDPPVLTYKQGIQMLRDAGVDVPEYEDLSTPNEKLLGKLVKEKYDTDFYILDKYPLAVRPFYTMPDFQDSILSNSYDMFIRGEEILSGAQRIHDPTLLTQRAEHHNISLEKLKPYIDSFRYGAPPHAGGGIGLERLVFLYTDIGNVRRTSMFPRDPKRLEP